MMTAYLPFAFNLFLLLFWVRLWSAPDREFYFNPFLSGTIRLTDTTLAFLRPVLYLPEAAASLVIMLFALVFRTLVMERLSVVWTLTFGLSYQFTPPISVEAGPVAWKTLLLFSTLQFAGFLLKLWSVYLAVRLITPALRVTRATEAFDFFARPFSRLPLAAQPVVLALLYLGLAFAATRLGVPSTIDLANQEVKPTLVSPFLSGTLAAQCLKTGWLAVLGLSDGLALLIRALFVLILGNLAAAVFQAQGAMIICNEGVELLMGRFARNRAMTGAGFDFTPLVFFFAVNMVYRTICIGLFNLINTPIFN